MSPKNYNTTRRLLKSNFERSKNEGKLVFKYADYLIKWLIGFPGNFIVVVKASIDPYEGTFLKIDHLLIKRVVFSAILSFIFNFGFCQKGIIRLAQYLYPNSDSMRFNCTYNPYHAKGLHDTVTLKFEKLEIENVTAYCISRVDDKNCQKVN